ncbi:MAG: hypothetical protein ACOY3D_05335 [Candidatus Omnitrophota bacterium]
MNIKRLLLKVIVTAWIINWLFFIELSLVVKGAGEKYLQLIGKPLKEKREIIYGQRFLRFLDHYKASLPDGASYQLSGIDEDSLDYVIAIYYLYPLLKSETPDFTLINDSKNHDKFQIPISKSQTISNTQ